MVINRLSALVSDLGVGSGLVHATSGAGGVFQIFGMFWHVSGLAVHGRAPDGTARGPSARPRASGSTTAARCTPP
jgi:hypothetical protein